MLSWVRYSHGCQCQLAGGHALLGRLFWAPHASNFGKYIEVTNTGCKQGQSSTSKSLSLSLDVMPRRGETHASSVRSSHTIVQTVVSAGPPESMLVKAKVEDAAGVVSAGPPDSLLVNAKVEYAAGGAWVFFLGCNWSRGGHTDGPSMSLI